ncbi:hypothetical protein G3I60_11640 [Streptomyces sp. SID13666]|uniref:hypothetical protein n=1 Tax=Streptomyces TaxID=1883 RepID=UPI0013C12D52|nr:MULTISPECIES: hypothetical protein [Streptomyces]MCZ4098435.1 hypothetical protein [Streptomyces sp. H39-C1]NEA54779.1 hypothetical protein [Streptomyces sp. SID13666]NEA70569.1 hypothetical protein [Streptomyces sp. SID13588]QNA77361.1 hypothetical protein C8250_041065 [Streptomyces sp. So13.3]
MTQSQTDRGPAGWRVLMLIGLFGLVVRRLAGEPFSTLLDCPLGIVDLAGLLVARRK